VIRWTVNPDKQGQYLRSVPNYSSTSPVPLQNAQSAYWCEYGRRGIFPSPSHCGHVRAILIGADSGNLVGLYGLGSTRR
jgi:hypothetical protein